MADEGKGFDHGGVVDPTDPARRLIPGGRGVFLMRRLVDRLEYNEAGNAVRLVVSGRRRRGPASSR
jgi:anti-sigma regulatory factor (Ser/Thr protein kinase)